MPDGVDLTLEIKEALEIDNTNILEELRRHSAKYFYYGVLWARAARNQRRVHRALRALEAELMKEARAENPKLSAEMKAEYLNLHPRYQEAFQEENQATYMEEVLGIARDSMKQRGMALQELARHHREETIYGDEFKAMKNEYDERVEERPKRGRRVHRAEVTPLAKEQEVSK
jgi:hypothetical protein